MRSNWFYIFFQKSFWILQISEIKISSYLYLKVFLDGLLSLEFKLIFSHQTPEEYAVFSHHVWCQCFGHLWHRDITVYLLAPSIHLSINTTMMITNKTIKRCCLIYDINLELWTYDKNSIKKFYKKLQIILYKVGLPNSFVSRLDSLKVI